MDQFYKQGVHEEEEEAPPGSYMRMMQARNGLGQAAIVTPPDASKPF